MRGMKEKEVNDEFYVYSIFVIDIVSIYRRQSTISLVCLWFQHSARAHKQLHTCLRWNRSFSSIHSPIYQFVIVCFLFIMIYIAEHIFVAINRILWAYTCVCVCVHEGWTNMHLHPFLVQHIVFNITCAIIHYWLYTFEAIRTQATCSPFIDRFKIRFMFYVHTVASRLSVKQSVVLYSEYRSIRWRNTKQT